MTESRIAALEREVRELREELTRRSTRHLRQDESAPGRASVLVEREAIAEDVERLAHVGSWCMNLETSELTWSEEFFRILGLDPAGAVATPESFFAAVHPDDRAEVQAAHERSVATGMVGLDVPCRVVRPDGSMRYIVLSGSAICDSTGNMVRSVGAMLDVTPFVLVQEELRRTSERLLQDVTERKELEEQLRHSQKMEAIGTLAGGVAHDFNNYLLVIQSGLDLLRNNYLSESDREILQDIDLAANRCETLTRQLLTFSRKQAARPRRIDLNQLVKDASRLLRRLVGEHIALVVQVEAEPATIWADPGHIEQVIMNLAINSRDAMPAGGLLTLQTERRIAAGESPSLALEGDAVLLRVVDSGCGIPDEHRQRVFEPFFTTKEQGHGTGLGLATAYGIVQQCGGKIEFSSQVGRGTTFEVSFPCFDDDTHTRAHSARPPSARGDEAILLVEDEPRVRRLTCLLLERAGYRVVEAADGEEALTVAKGRPAFDLVITDLTMPKMGGIELMRRLRLDHPGQRVLLMSGYPERPGLQAPQDDLRRSLIHKPFTSEKLLARVRLALDEPLGGSG